jgi:hypothetical protein
MNTEFTDSCGFASSAGLGADEGLKPLRTGPKPVSTVEELQTLDEDAMVNGYLAGLRNTADFLIRERGYWHGYLNGLVDGGHAKSSPEQAELARAYLNSGALMKDVMRWSDDVGALPN